MTADTFCRGCGHLMGPGGPPADGCGYCPPKQCEDCGQMDSATAPCKCWISLEGMPLADLKAILAKGDLSVDLPIQRDAAK